MLFSDPESCLYILSMVVWIQFGVVKQVWSVLVDESAAAIDVSGDNSSRAMLTNKASPDFQLL